MVSSSKMAVVRFTFSVRSSLKAVISNSLLASFKALMGYLFLLRLNDHFVEDYLKYFVSVGSFIFF